MNLMLDGSGLQPFLFILLFTVVMMYITTGFRDKPWLLVLGTLAVGAVAFLGLYGFSSTSTSATLGMSCSLVVDTSQDQDFRNGC